MATSAVYQRGTNGRQSMLEKSLERRRVNKEHNSNFRAGHVPVHEEHLHKVGLRGRKRYFAYCFLALLYISAIANLVITALLMWTLRIDQHGLQSLQFLRGGLIRFLDEVELERVVVNRGQLGGFGERDLDIVAQDSSVRVVSHGKSSPSVEVSAEETVLRGAKGLEVISPKTGAPIFHTDEKREPILPRTMDTLQSSLITASKIASGTDEELTISSDKTVDLHGSSALNVHAQRLEMKAKEVVVTSISSLTLDGSLGTYLNATLLPRAQGVVSNRPRADAYKLCACRTSGRVFRVPASVSGQRSPCASLLQGFNLCG